MKKEKLPELHSKTSTGKIKHWQIYVTADTEKSKSTITTKYWTDGSVVKENSKVISTGKNIGKKNETTPWEQACFDAKSKWNKKLDEGYVEDLKNIEDEVLLPMLALKFQDRKHDIVYPAFTQPKLDGIRCFVTKESSIRITYSSRKGKLFTTLDHLTPDLLKIMKTGDIFDGELYTHDLTFQELTAAIKKQRDNTKKVQFWVFDYADPLDNFEYRLKIIKDRLSKYKGNKIILTPTDIVNSEEEIYAKHDEYVKHGFEGVIIRNKLGKYTFKHRSHNLQKHKKFIDEEFVITGGTCGTGNEKDCVVFECKTKSGDYFMVRPRGSFELRQQWWEDLDNIIGKKLTVRYQNLSDSGIPRFPVGVNIRDYE